jgi:parvulin-like peptidyl-prolyl isomerase
MSRTVATLLALCACGNSDPPAPAPAAPEPVAPAPSEPAPDPITHPDVVAAANEACASVVVVAWQRAPHAADTVTRTQDEARARATELHARLTAPGADFAAVAREASDAASSGPRGGLLGTYGRDEWPAAHEAIRDAVFGLDVGATSAVLEAPYGFVVARRCAVEKIHTRHVLVRFAGARNAPAEITRSRDEARVIATEIHAALTAPGADFAAIAGARSEDGSRERSGDMGTFGRGRLVAPYEAAAFALAPGAVSDVVESEFGFHVIQRLPE